MRAAHLGEWNQGLSSIWTVVRPNKCNGSRRRHSTLDLVLDLNSLTRHNLVLGQYLVLRPVVLRANLNLNGRKDRARSCRVESIKKKACPVLPGVLTNKIRVFMLAVERASVYTRSIVYWHTCCNWQSTGVSRWARTCTTLGRARGEGSMREGCNVGISMSHGGVTIEDAAGARVVSRLRPVGEPPEEKIK